MGQEGRTHTAICNLFGSPEVIPITFAHSLLIRTTHMILKLQENGGVKGNTDSLPGIVYIVPSKPICNYYSPNSTHKEL